MKKIFLLLVIVMGMFVTGCFVDEGKQMANEVAEKTLNGDNAIAVYERFKRLEEGIQKKYRQEQTAQRSIDDFVSILPKDKSKWSSQDKGEIQRLRMIADGIRYSVDDMIADYNAESKMVNKAIFKDNLPTNIFRGVNQALEFKYNKKLEVLPHSNN